MILVTCYKKDCPTPHFYVNPKGGKIKLIAGADSPNVAIEVSKLNQLRNIVAEMQQDKVDISKEKLESLKEMLDFESIPNVPLDRAITITKKIENAKDYLIMQCESYHKNYIIIEEFPKKDKEPK